MVASVFATLPSPGPCPVCAAGCSLLDVVDFNKSCEELHGKYFPLIGIPIYYAICGECGFCFAPEFSRWTLEDFADRIYNSDYIEVDPEYVDTRPRANAQNLKKLLGDRGPGVRHLDYGGGNGLLSRLLRDAGWQTHSYDPFVDRGVTVESLGKFDLITALEVFEHVPDVAKLMADLSSLLAADGVVLFSTVLSDGNLARGQRLTWWYASPRNGHISLYSRHSLSLLGASEGLNFGSRSVDFHAFWSNIPPWAAYLLSEIS